MTTAEELGIELDAIDDEIANLKRRREDVVDRMAAEMPEDLLRVEELGKTFKRRRKADRKAWRHDELRSELLRKVRTLEPQKTMDLATGEIVVEDPTEQAFWVIFESARPEWRINSLRNYDLAADEFCEVTRGGWTIQILDDLL
jgi:hypothetical protein